MNENSIEFINKISLFEVFENLDIIIDSSLLSGLHISDLLKCFSELLLFLSKFDVSFISRRGGLLHVRWSKCEFLSLMSDPV